MRIVVWLITCLLLLSTLVSAQGGKLYNNPVERYQILLEEDWNDISELDTSGPQRVKFIFRGGSDQGDLKIRKGSLNGGTLEEFIQKDEGNSLRYLPGYLAIKKQEPFGGGLLAGRMVEYSFKRFNKEAAGRNYYLTDSKGNVWVLSFAGRPLNIRSLRPSTDRMARSFKPLE